MFEGSEPGPRPARWAFSPGVCVVAVIAEAAGNRSENGWFAAVSMGPDGPGLSLRRIVVPEVSSRNALAAPTAHRCTRDPTPHWRQRKR